MTRFDYDIGILGAGSAGLTVASGAAQLGARTLLIEKEGRLGGDCLHYGCVPSKTLIRTANVRHLMHNARFFGLPAARLSPVDFRRVSDRIRSVIEVIQKHDSVERFCSLGVKVEFGEPGFADEHTVTLGDSRLSARTWVVATGSSPFIPPIEGLAQTPFVTNREIFSLERLPASMVVLGGGPVAVEMAQAFGRLGSEVTVIQRSAQILSREDPDMADGVMRALEAEGVTFLLNTVVKRVRDLGTLREVVVETAGAQRSLRAETILVALGRTPNLAGLELENAGVLFDPRGLRLDSRLRTSSRHIYGAGDVTGAYQFTHAAGYEGGVVIGNAVFRLPRKADYTWMPWCTFTSPELASIGMNEKRAAEAGIEFSVWTENVADNDRGQAEGETAGRIKMILGPRERLLGVQILGPHAGDLLAEWCSVLNGGVKLSTLASAVHPYPTLAELNRKVAGNLLASKLFSDRVRKGLHFFFSLRGRACGERDAGT